MVKIMLVTANVGSVFENLEKGLSIWVDEFVSTVGSKSPEFVAVHFQETGGKNYENGSDCVSIFFGQLLERMGEIGFSRAEGFVDSRSDLEDQFTALSSIYFVHESVQPHALTIWDFQERCFKELPASAKLHAGPELELTGRRQKEKFPKNFYPNGKWSRKGFLRTRWSINGDVLDFVNIHLFHDSDNTVAANSFPSQFAQSRENALKYTLKRLQADVTDPFHMFVFGDFNFRVNTKGVMSVLKREFGEIDNENGPLKLKTKKFECPRLEEKFLKNYEWLKKYDFEAKLQGDTLQEFDLKFHPSYPFEEDDSLPEHFLRTRCPAWCDRILFTPQTQLNIISEESPIEYNVIGSTAYMGDHKPVYLSFTLSSSLAIHSTSNDVRPPPYSPANKSAASGGSSVEESPEPPKYVEKR